MWHSIQFASGGQGVRSIVRNGGGEVVGEEEGDGEGRGQSDSGHDKGNEGGDGIDIGVESQEGGGDEYGGNGDGDDS